MRRNHLFLGTVVLCNLLLFQNCGSPIQSKKTTIFEEASNDSFGQGLGSKILSYDSESPKNLAPGVDAEDKSLAWYSSGQVVETTTRHTTAGDVVDSVNVAVFAFDQSYIKDAIQALPDVTTFTPVAGTSVPCDIGDSRYVAYRRDGTSVVLLEERDCSTEFKSNAYNEVLVAKMKAIRALLN